MNLARIQGPEAIVRGMRDLPDAIVVWSSTDRLSDGQLSVAAYATDRAVAEIRQRGAQVTLVADNDEIDARLDVLFAAVDDTEDTEPPVA